MEEAAAPIPPNIVVLYGLQTLGTIPDPLTRVGTVPDRAQYRLQVWKNSVGSTLSRLSYTDAHWITLNSANLRKTVTSPDHSMITLYFQVSYHSSSDITIVSLYKLPSPSVSIHVTDYTLTQNYLTRSGPLDSTPIPTMQF